MATIINGKEVSQKVKDALKAKIASVHPKPGLAVVLVGDNPASKVYVGNKEKACQEIGFLSQKIILPESVSGDELLSTVKELNADLTIHGILVQFPLPERLKHMEEIIIQTIDPEKDIDGFHPTNVGKFMTCKGICDDLFLPCTPAGIMELLHAYTIPISGKHAVILGRSNLVGKPIGMLLLGEDATVTLCHSKTTHLKEITKQADILIAAIGKPNFVDESFIKPGVVIIDVGINRTEQGLVGDVNYTSVEQIASAITPVPGGVGPMTIAMLMENVWKAYIHQTRREETM
ncbi:MAG: bifunctional methylenetetrahydrofolate dehydrogenase/methenyltetrahydrofolate cyclohydrolase FolD [Candidatus Gottesmanbacteria bacterium]